MIIRGIQGFISEIFWRPFLGIWTVFTGLASLLAWHDVGEDWSGSIKVLVGVVIPLLVLLIYVLYVAYSLVDQPLRVRKVAQGTHYFRDNVVIILERCDTVSVGDILTLFVREGDAELPICLISVESINNKNFPQSVVLRPLTDELLDYLRDESRIEQLQAKRSVTRRYLECLIMQ